MMTIQNSSLSILIAEDSLTQAERLRFILEGNGYEVQAAKNGKEALAMLAERQPGLVISDINMPEMDGYELCAHIKSDAELAKVPVILATSLSETRDLLQGLECGADSYITKPYDEAALLNAVRRVLEVGKVLPDENTLLVSFSGESYRIGNNASRILNFLMTTYDLALEKNVSLSDANARLYGEITERERAEERLRESNDFLSILCKVSTVTSETIEMDELITRIINAVTSIGMLKCEPGGVIFLAGDESLHLAGDTGCPKECREEHPDLPFGTCLCGLAAKTGEVIISMNSETDSRHTIHSPGISAHGHIVIPLKAKNGLAGVMCLDMAPDTQLEVDGRMTELFVALGQQIGLALDNARLYEETRKSSLHDPLTGAANRRMMDVLMEKQFSITKRNNGRLSIIMFDIDHFKRFNDTMGHAEGDKALAAVAHFASESRRESDTVFRYGGEEFLVLLPETPLSGALVVAEGIRSAIERQSPVTVSLGAASYVEGMKQKEELIVKADEALYRAKQGGRNRVEI